MQNPWDQRAKESSRAFAAFIAYRDLGLYRSCNALAKQLKMNPSSVLELFNRHRWKERVRAWDAHVDEITQKEQIEAAKLMKKRQIALALQAQDAAQKGLRRFIAQFDKEKISPYAIKPDSLSKLLEVGCRIERLNRDEPEHNVEILQSKFDKLSLEECEILRSLMAKAEGAQ